MCVEPGRRPRPREVDRVSFEIDRSGLSEGNRCSLDTLQFTQAVPEPASYALLGARLLLIGLRRIRRRPRLTPR